MNRTDRIETAKSAETMSPPSSNLSPAEKQQATSPAEQSSGGIVLCGGKSRRMGQPKHLLPLDGKTLLEQMVATLSQVVSPVVVVRAPGMPLPTLPPGVLVREDEQPGLGPLAGMAAGLKSLQGKCQRAFVTSCDAPLLKPPVIRFALQQAAQADVDVAVFREKEHLHVLCGVYAVSLLPKIEELLTARRLRPLFLVEECRSLIIDVHDVRPLDPALHSFRNANTPEEYRQIVALYQAGRSSESC